MTGHNVDEPEREFVEHFTIEEYLSLFDGDTGRFELWDGEIRVDGRPFYDMVKQYLAMRGETVCPLTENE